MKCQLLFFRKNRKKNITKLSSAAFAQRVVKVKVNVIAAAQIQF